MLTTRPFSSHSVQILGFLLLIGLWGFVPVLAQSQQAEEEVDYFKKWLSEDVVYIISEEEKEVFDNLQTTEEKELFIEQFWFRRDPDPRSAENEYKEEHYRRIQYANEHFTSGKDGWRTDRGMIYIRFGPPDRREANPSGGYYQRPSWEGGGSTTTFPFERWEYRHLEGIGDDIEIEFVDPTLTGEYRMTMNPDDKDAMLVVPNAGMTDAEFHGLTTRVSRIARVTNPMPWRNPLLTGYGRIKDQPFEKLTTFTKLQQSPQVSFQDLIRTQVETDVRYGNLPFELGTEFLPVGDDTYLVPLTLSIPSKELTYEPSESGPLESILEVYGRVTGLTGQEIEIFEETIISRVASGELDRNRDSVYQRTLELEPGRYKLEIIVRDGTSEKLGARNAGVILPALSEEELTLSSVVLADRIEIENQETGAFGPARVFPNVKHSFSTTQSLLVFYQLSHFSVDEASMAPDIVSEATIQKDGEVLASSRHQVDPEEGRNRPRLHLVHDFDLHPIRPDSYNLVLEIQDRISGQRLTRRVPFIVRPE